MNLLWAPCGGGDYWDECWRRAPGSLEIWRWGVILRARDNGKFYVSARSGKVSRAEDFGPFETFDEAAQAAETIHNINGAPSHWPRFVHPL